MRTVPFLALCAALLARAPAHAEPLSSSNPSVTINGGRFSVYNPQSTGTGSFFPFLRIHDNADPEEGYNTDARPLELDQNNSPNFTRSITLGAVSKTSDGYRRILLDLGEPGSDNLITLTALRIYVGDYANVNQLADLVNPVYDLDNPADSLLDILDESSGNGQADVAIDIPESLFAGKNATDSFVLYASFNNAHGTFEEFGAGSAGGGNDPPVIVTENPPVPEPTSVLLLVGVALGGGLWARRLKARQSA